VPIVSRSEEVVFAPPFVSGDPTVVIFPLTRSASANHMSRTVLRRSRHVRPISTPPIRVNVETASTVMTSCGSGLSVVGRETWADQSGPGVVAGGILRSTPVESIARRSLVCWRARDVDRFGDGNGAR